MQPSRVSRVIGAGRFAVSVSVLLMFTENWSERSLFLSIVVIENRAEKAQEIVRYRLCSMDSRPVPLCGLRNRPQRDALRYLSVLRVGNLAHLLFTAAGALPVLTMGVGSAPHTLHR